jgi:hypothetical protein
MITKNDINQKADELNIKAAKGLPMPDDLKQPEQLYYLSLRYLYKEYRAGRIEKTQAQKERQQLTEAFIDNMYNYSMYKHQVEVHKVYAKEFQNIKNDGCKVCQKLYKTLCGLGLDEAINNEST